MRLTYTYNRDRVGKNCLTCLLLGKGLKRGRCSIAIAFELWFRMSHYEGLGKPEWLKLNGTNQL
jgi:hypothetical protein